MDIIAPSEERMWNKLEISDQAKTASEINAKYAHGENRIVVESNREKLPNFVEALRRQDYMNLRPAYQRRPRWDGARKSRLIESFIINVPVPPIFLYENDFNSYEVMDGQQRITAIRDFYENRFQLEDLDLWPELNGLTYDELPALVKAGLDRRSISSIVLLKESAPRDEQAQLLRQLVFERLNTGAVKLEKQEIRNALYQGKLNDLLRELSRLDKFRLAWKQPKYSLEEENSDNHAEIYQSKFFQQMDDLEVILRFFAFRHYDKFKRGIQGFLDLYMVRSQRFTDHDISVLRTLYIQTLDLAVAIYGDLIFRPFDPEKQAWSDNPEKAYHDAIMVASSKFLEHSTLLIQERESIINKTREMFSSSDIVDDPYIWRLGTKLAVSKRIGAVISIFEEVVNRNK